MSLLNTLNAEQLAAATTTQGPVLVLAGAGSGKTRVITYRIAYLIQQEQVRPERILAVTFTNKAAKEMQTRVEKLLLSDNGHKLTATPLISTFHSLCVRILRQHIERLPANEYGVAYNRNFTIYDGDDQAKLIKGCLKSLEIDEKLLPVRFVQSSISNAKSHGQSWQTIAARGAGLHSGAELKQEALARVYKLYEQRLANSNALDFDDLLLKTVQLLKHSEETRNYYNQRFNYILIDEYQDTNPPQFALIRQLTEQTQNLCVVGDPDQSIYRFRAADIQNILDFEKHYPKAKTIKLTENYRSTKNILETANRVIRNNTQRKEKDLRTFNEPGDKIRYFQAYDADNEADFVINRIARHLREEPGTHAVVLYRTNAQSRLFEEACRRVGIRYNIVGGFSFYERAEIKDIVAYLKLLLNPNDNMAFSRVINTPQRGIGKTTLDTIISTANNNQISYWDAISLMLNSINTSSRSLGPLNSFKYLIERLQERLAHLSLTDAVKMVISETGYSKMLTEEHTPESEARLLNLEELVNAAVESENRQEGLRDFLDHAALVADIDSYDGNIPVTLMTVHSAKGLEFPIVFLVGMEQGLFPHSRAVSDHLELEEERRICYVAITRAERYLYITHAVNRRVYGEETECEPSQFLKELPLELLEDLSRGQSWLQMMQQGRLSSTNSATKSAISSVGLNKASNYKTYNSVDSVQDFFKQRQGSSNFNQGIPNKASSVASPKSSKTTSGGGLRPGMRVKHAKYGEGLILKREGDGEEAKLLISFPGFGQKKLVEKFANLVKA